MRAIDRTIYPRLSANPTRRELIVEFTPTPEEADWINRRFTKSLPHRLTFAVMFKVFQRLGYFPAWSEIPVPVIAHVRASLKLRRELKPAVVDPNTTWLRYQRDIRDRQGVRVYGHAERRGVMETVAERAAVLDYPSDLINVAIEHLAQEHIELPAFSTLDRLTRRLRALVNRRYFARIAERLTEDDHRRLDDLLEVPAGGKSIFNTLKPGERRDSKRHFKALLDHIDTLDRLVDVPGVLEGLPDVKRRHFAGEAAKLDASELRRFAPLKRHVVLLCLLHDARIQARDDLLEMFVQRIAKIHHQAKAALDALRNQFREKDEAIRATMADVARLLLANPVDADAGREIRRLVTNQGGAQDLLANCTKLQAYDGDNYLSLLPEPFKSFRNLFFRMARTIELHSTSEDTALITALQTLLAMPDRTPQLLPVPSDLSFTTEAWRELLIQRPAQGEPFMDRRLYEICVFSSLANDLKSGDIAAAGAEAFGDYREQLVPWAECEPEIPEYCARLQLPATAAEFVDELRTRLTHAAELTDRAYMEDQTLAIDDDGIPILKRHKARPIPAGVPELANAIMVRMPEVSVIQILCDLQHWSNWTRHFQPASGSEPKLKNASERYILTGFAYGCNLGPVQASRHLGGVVTAHELGFVNQRHIDGPKLEAASRDIVNLYAGLSLPRFWGDGSAAAADGTQHELYEQNLIASRHIRYGGYGGIAYHHVSDTYIAFFSQFITCGVWEGVYLLDGLLKNTSDLQPTKIHADTQGQSYTVFGLAHLLGIELMPRIRNWKDYRFYRPDAKVRYDHIDAMFKERIDWVFIERHWKDLMQVVISIRNGRMAASTLLRKLGAASRKNRLYHAFKELGAAVRTLFLLRYISDLQLREQITAATNKVEAFNGFSKHLFFGGEGVIARNDPVEQEKAIKYNNVVANAVMCWNAVQQSRLIRLLRKSGWKITSTQVAYLSPYLTSHIKRFGDYKIDIKLVPPPVEPDLDLDD